MRNSYDFAPLYRSGVGFDRMFDILENARSQPAESWPPYDIIKTGENAYRISMAVAGFAPDELNISTELNLLVVTGQRDDASTGDYLHRGIAGRPFSCRFELADHVKVTGANLANGMLTIDLLRELPEEMKPRRIEIRAEGATKAGSSELGLRAA